MTWLQSNLVNIVIILLIIALLYGCIRSLWNDHKKGCSSCGGKCSGCSACSNLAEGIETIRRQQLAERKGA